MPRGRSAAVARISCAATSRRSWRRRCLTILTVDFAIVMLAESGLSFLGIGIQPPEITWGLMVAQGRNYLSQAWWLAFFPGLAIMFATLSANLLSNWLRIVTDPVQRWRLEAPRGEND